MEFDLRSRTIFLTVSGSRAYGTNTPESDFDLRGLAVAPLSYSTGFLRTFEQYEGKLDWPEIPEQARAGTDVVVYDVRKFFKLATDANPNVLELLFAPEDCLLITTGRMQKIFDARDLFLSKKVRFSYSGYAHAQMKRIRTHRKWLLNPITRKPSREDFGLPEHSPIPADQWRAALALVERQTAEWTFHPDEEVPITVLTRLREQIVDMVATIFATNAAEADRAIFKAAGRKLSMDDNFLELLDAEKRYRAALNEYNQYETWKKTRNPARAELEARFGFDCKHASHCVRLIRSCEELLTTGKLHVRRPDAEELRAIRNGAWTFDQLEEAVLSLDRRMDVHYKSPSCPLPHQPDRVALDKLCSEIVETFKP